MKKPNILLLWTDRQRADSISSPGGIPELFHPVENLRESVNRAADPTCKNILRDLGERLREQRVEKGDDLRLRW